MHPQRAIEKTLSEVRAVIRRKHLSYTTEKCYCGWIARYSRYVLRLDPALASERKFEAFLTSLAKDGMSATTQNQAFNAILFLYRVVRLPDSVMTDLRDQIKRARLIWELDQSAGVPVPLPDKLGRKYRGAEMSWSWAWLFPSKSTCHHPRTRQIVRWRCHESNVQRAVRAAALRLGLESGITPHHLRHAYATHALDAGANVRDVQAALGHKSLETTMVYVHSHAERVRSPLDLLSRHRPIATVSVSATAC